MKRAKPPPPVGRICQQQFDNSIAQQDKGITLPSFAIGFSVGYHGMHSPFNAMLTA